VAGRLLALASLVLITVPVLAAYAADIAAVATGAHARQGALVIVLATGVGLAVQGGSLLAWIVGLGRTALRARLAWRRPD
jgi:hypothetical protein